MTPVARGREGHFCRHILIFVSANFREIASFLRIAFTFCFVGAGLYAAFSQNPNIPTGIKIASTLILSFYGVILVVGIVGIIIALYWDRSEKFQKLTSAFTKLPKAIRFVIWAATVLVGFVGITELTVSLACGQWGGGC